MNATYRAIQEKKKEMDFLATESETLVKLVGAARDKGMKVQNDMQELKNVSLEITKIFSEKGLILDQKSISDIPLKFNTCVGIDGSFQLVGGAGGVWYSPISVVRILFDDLKSQPVVDVFWADIVEIEEWSRKSTVPPSDDDQNQEANQDFRANKPNYIAANYMLGHETKAIFNWGTRYTKSFVLLDGPIVDPPVFSIGGSEYIEERCNAIKECLKHSIVVGCAKRNRDRFFLDKLAKELSSEEVSKLTRFPIDQYLMAYVFANIRSGGYQDPLFTTHIDVSESNPVYRAYKKNGINIWSVFYQKGLMSQILRLDIPVPEDVIEESAIREQVLFAVKAVNEWTLPGHDYPVPVFLAHEKCNIREGCAEVLYEEIMTGSRTADPSNQAILSWLR